MIVKNGESLFGVYLAGAFHFNWAKQVMGACEGLPFFFINPMKGWTEKEIQLLGNKIEILPDMSGISLEIKDK